MVDLSAYYMVDMMVDLIVVELVALKADKMVIEG